MTKTPLEAGLSPFTVTIWASGDNENTPAEAVHHALAYAHKAGFIVYWSDPVPALTRRHRQSPPGEFCTRCSNFRTRKRDDGWFCYDCNAHFEPKAASSAER